MNFMTQRNCSPHTSSRVLRGISNTRNRATSHEIPRSARGDVQAVTIQQPLNILLAQINPTVGAIEYNTEKVLNIIQEHQASHDLILFPELALCGYPPEDLLFRPTFRDNIARALEKVTAATQTCCVVIGHPHWENNQCYNAASILHQQQCLGRYYKQQLPNYGVFDEKRYFTPGPRIACTFRLKSYVLGLCICEDLWQGQTIDDLLNTDANVLCILNASPFDVTKLSQREALLSPCAQKNKIVVYVNMVGAQDELVFDGQSMVIDGQNQLQALGPAFQEWVSSCCVMGHHVMGTRVPRSDKIALIYHALICGLRDYVIKNNFPGVLLGLSGGIDSALTLAIAVDALGADRVRAVIMPSQYSADISLIDAMTQINTQNVIYHTLPIEPCVQTVLSTLQTAVPISSLGLPAENAQARIRAVLLMALSNQTGYMLISTSNKSEVAVGYTTLYGDMCGGYAVIKDVLKTQVYELAHWRNQQSPVIPERVLTRAPSAELAPNQTDQDSLPDYATLDAIIQGYMEQRLSFEALIAAGHSRDVVSQVLHLIKHNEYKRHQAPPGTKISPCAFGRDWRYPISQQFSETHGNDSVSSRS